MVAVDKSASIVSIMFQKFADACPDVRGEPPRSVCEAFQISVHMADTVRSRNGQVPEFEKKLSEAWATLELSMAKAV